MKKLIKLEVFIQTLIMLCMIVLASWGIYQNWYIFTQNKWEVKNYTAQSLNGAILPSFREKTAMKALVEETFNIPHTYFEYNETWDCNTVGRACPQLNIVFVDRDLEGVEYATTLAHELSHCKYQSINECYVEYMAIVTLIESDCEWVHSLGMYWARVILSGAKQGTKYDCGWYLVEYFKGE